MYTEEDGRLSMCKEGVSINMEMTSEQKKSIDVFIAELEDKYKFTETLREIKEVLCTAQHSEK